MTAERVDQDLQKFAVTRDEVPWQTNERLLVAISHSPYSERIIRATRRLAYNLEAPWVAVYVDTGLNLNDEDQSQLQKNIQLARELNAEVILTTDSDVSTALQRVSRQKNVTQVIVGRPTRSWFRDAIDGGSILQKLVNENHDVDVHVIRQESRTNARPGFMAELAMYRSKTGLFKYYYAFWFMVVVTLLGALFEPYIGYRAVGFFFLLAVIIASLAGSIGAVLFTATLSALIWNFGFIPPRFTLVISSADDLILCISYFVVALITGFLTNRIRGHAKLIRAREERTNLINEILQDIARSQNKSEFIQKVCDRVSNHLDAYTTVVLKSKDGFLQFDKLTGSHYLDEKEKAVAQWTFQNQKNAGWSTDTLGQARSLYLPLRGVNEAVGVLIFKPERKIKKLSLDHLELLFSVSTQLGISIERHFLSRRLVEAQRLKDSEVLHQTLLNSISHEMRTPLTAVMGVSSAIEAISKSNPELLEISRGLSEAGDRLNRVIENLLDMSRLSSGILGLKLEWHDLTDLVGVVLKKLEKNLHGHVVHANITESVDFVEIDFRLFEHALSNLILNATQYAGAHCQISISIEQSATTIVIKVCDDGVGIPEESFPLVFEKFYRLPGTPAGGTGLGLSIVQGIVELHKGQIHCEKNRPQGTCFVIDLPYKKMPPVQIQEDT